MREPNVALQCSLYIPKGVRKKNGPPFYGGDEWMPD